MRVDGARLGRVDPGEGALGELLAGHRAAGALHQVGEDVELVARERDGRARDLDDAPVEVDRDVGPGDDPARRLLGQPEARADAGEELLQEEGLGDEVHGAEREAAEPVVEVDARREDDDRRVGAALQRLEQVEARDAGEHQVEHDQIDPALRQRRPRVAPVADELDVEAPLAQPAREAPRHARVVLDHQKARAPPARHWQ